jgi:hypothetical protein
VVDQKEHYQHSDDDPAPFFQYVNMNVLVDKVDDIVADKGIDDNGGKGSAEHDQKIIDHSVIQQVPDDGPYHRSCHKKGKHDKQEKPDRTVLFNRGLLVLGGEFRLSDSLVKELRLDDVSHHQDHNAVCNQNNDDFKEKII